ncbi:MAG: RNA-binding protein [Oscillospiraceae bacterium]
MKKIIKNNYKIGDIVECNAGRGSGKVFVIFWIDGIYVGICDGDTRKIDNIKKKKIIHLTETGRHSEFIATAVTENKHIENSDVRKQLEQL